MSEAQLIAATDAELGIEPSDKPRGMLVRAWEVFAENRLALVSIGFIGFIVLFCFVGPHIYVTNQTNTDLSTYLCRPSGAHLLGCNDLGYDELGRLMVGGQTSLEVGIAAAVVSVLVGTLYGAISGFAGGVVNAVMMRIVDAGLSLPSLMVLMILSVIFHPTPTVIIFIIAIFYWFGVARLIRGETLALRNREYVQAVRVIGGQAVALGDQAHPAERGWHGHRPGHVRGRGRDPHAVDPRLPHPGRGAARDRLGLDALRRPDLHPGRQLLVADLSAGSGDHPDLHRVQLHR